MTSWVVRVPLVGEVQVTVTAASEEDAIEQALDMVSDALLVAPMGPSIELIELDPVREINDGSVCLTLCSKATAERCQ